ncbi:MAG TPA: Ig-like domain-containing protein, partial [Gemmatimonadales bacterium]
MDMLRPFRLSLLVATIAAGSISCSGDGNVDTPGPAALVQVGGDNQAGPINQPLADSLVVRVDDSQGQPVSGITVSWSVENGAGAVSPASVVTGSDGRAAVQWTLGANAGHHTVTAVVTDLQAVVFDATAEVSGVAHLEVAQQPSSSAISGVPLTEQPAIQVQNAAGQPVPGVRVTASVEGATLSGTNPVESDASGVARFTDLALTGGAGSYPLSFTAPEMASVQSNAVTLGTGGNASGQWTAPFDWPIVAIHSILLPSGKVLTIGRTGNPTVWDPASGNFTSMPSPAWLFCAGHALLPDGRVLVAGGHIRDGFGLPNTTIFSDAAGWSSSATMVRGRWYPTVTITANGEALITAGTDQDSMDVTIPEVWSNGALRQLPGAELQLPWYPRVFQAPDGRLYIPGGAQSTFFMSTAGSGSVTPGPRRVFGGRNYGSAVMYDDGKILYVGGGFTPDLQQ